MATQHHRKEDTTDEDKKLSGFGLLIKYPWKVAAIIITAIITIIAMSNMARATLKTTIAVL